MNQTSSHWGSLEIGATEETRGPLRNLIKTELSDTRAFVDRLYTDFTRAGRRAVAAQLIESRDDLPWFIALYRPGRLTGR